VVGQHRHPHEARLIAGALALGLAACHDAGSTNGQFPECLSWPRGTQIHLRLTTDPFRSVVTHRAAEWINGQIGAPVFTPQDAGTHVLVTDVALEDAAGWTALAWVECDITDAVVLFDVAPQTNMFELAAHELLHALGMSHGAGIMDPKAYTCNDETTCSLTDEQLGWLRSRYR
jgi:hypothetical protein